MNFGTALLPGKLIKRYKRFLADIVLDSGEVITAHCTNSGTMKTCLEVGAPVMVSKSNNPRRKTSYTWEMIFINGGWVGVNTLLPNKLVYEALKNKSIPQFQDMTSIQKEVSTGHSRIDFYITSSQEQCFLEVKNVTMKVGRYARFPDSVTTRGKKHLEELTRLKEDGFRAVMIYIIQRMDITQFGPASIIDPSYSKTLIAAHRKGVEIIPLQVMIGPTGAEIVREVPFDLMK